MSTKSRPFGFRRGRYSDRFMQHLLVDQRAIPAKLPNTNNTCRCFHWNLLQNDFFEKTRACTTLLGPPGRVGQVTRGRLLLINWQYALSLHVCHCVSSNKNVQLRRLQFIYIFHASLLCYPPFPEEGTEGFTPKVGEIVLEGFINIGNKPEEQKPVAPRITPRELEIIRLLAKGRSNKELS